MACYPAVFYSKRQLDRWPGWFRYRQYHASRLQRSVTFSLSCPHGIEQCRSYAGRSNLERKQPDRAEKVSCLLKYNALFMAGVMLLFLLFASPIISIFTNNPEVHAYGFCHCRSLAAAIFFTESECDDTGTKWSRRYRTPTGSIFLASGCSRYRLLSCWPRYLNWALVLSLLFL